MVYALVSLGPVVVSERYLSWLRDPEVTKYLKGGGDYTTESLTEYVAARRKDSYFFGIYVGGEYVGNAKLALNLRHRHADLGIMLGAREWWGKGVGTEAVRLMTEYGFYHGLHVITAGIIMGNEGSVEVFVRNGFRLVGTLPQYRWFEDGWRDELLYAKVAS